MRLSNALSVRAVWFSLACTLLAGGPGCGSSKPVVTKNEFPTASELEDLGEEETSEKSFYDQQRALVEKWTFSSEAANLTTTEAIEPQTAWERVISDRLSSESSKAIATVGMRCLAREVAAFYAKNKALPLGALRDVMRSRCGVVAPYFHVEQFTWDEVSDSPDFDEMANKWASSKQKALANLTEPPESVGVSWLSTDSGGRLFVVYGERQVDMQAIPTQYGPDETVVLRGRLHGDIENIDTLRNVGSFGYEKCRRDHKVKLPRFKVECDINPSTKWTHIEMLARPEDRVLAHRAVSLVVWKKGVATDTFETQAIGEALADSFSKGDDTAGDDEKPISAKEFAELVNAIRKRAHVGPATLEDAQSETARKLVSKYQTTDSSDVRDKIALGINAGWKIEKRITSAQFTTGLVPYPKVEALLETILSGPFGRRQLLDPDYTRLAVGLETSENGTLAAIVTTYRPVRERSLSKRATDVVKGLNVARKQSGRDEVTRDATLDDESERFAKKVKAGKWSPTKAAKKFLDTCVDKWNVSVRGQYVVTQTLDDVADVSKQIDVLLSPGVDRVGIFVVPVTPEGGAWTAYFVAIAIPSPDSSDLV